MLQGKFLVENLKEGSNAKTVGRWIKKPLNDATIERISGDFKFPVGSYMNSLLLSSHVPRTMIHFDETLGTRASAIRLD
jgi:hypothetical protein